MRGAFESITRGNLINKKGPHKKSRELLTAHGLKLQDKKISTHGQTSAPKIKVIALPGLIVYHYFYP